MRQAESSRIVRILVLFTLLTGASTLLPAADQSNQEDPVRQARELGTSGHRAEALGLLKQRLAQSPDDTDARVLYGIILSWEGRYDESREQLTQVLAKSPDHGDALPALINVELWSDHPNRAEQLAEGALHRHPDDPGYLLQEARALKAQRRSREAIQTLDHVLTLDPRNDQARTMRRSLKESSRQWEASFDHFYDHFKGGPGPQHEQWVSLKYFSPRISVTPRFERAYRFGLVSQQFEIDAYPSLWRHTYAYVNFGWSPDAVLYPRNRFGVDLFHNFPHGIEASAGYRHLTFSSKVNIYVASIAKYRGNWFFTGRTFLTPDNLGVSRTFVISARRFFGETGYHDYLDIRFAQGASLEQLRTTTEAQVLDSTGFSAEYDKSIASRWSVSFKGGWDREDRLGLSGIQRFFTRASLYFRF